MNPVPLAKRCKATSKGTGQPCKLPPMRGQTVCRKHGGGAPQARAAAAQRLAAQAIEKKASAVLAHEGLEPVADPLRELGKLASSAQAFQDALGARLNALNDVEAMDNKNAPHTRAVAELYERALDRTGKFLDMLVRHGYTERQIAISEQEALLVGGIIRRVLAALGLTPEQQKQGQALLAEEFRTLERNQK